MIDILLTTLIAAAFAVEPRPTDAPTPVCKVQQVHTPAGKLVHAAPILICPRATAIAERPASGTTAPAR